MTTQTAAQNAAWDRKIGRDRAKAKQKQGKPKRSRFFGIFVCSTLVVYGPISADPMISHRFGHGIPQGYTKSLTQAALSAMSAGALFMDEKGEPLEIEVTIETLNVRSCSSTSCGIVRKAKRGERAYVYDLSGDWMRIDPFQRMEAGQTNLLMPEDAIAMANMNMLVAAEALNTGRAGQPVLKSPLQDLSERQASGAPPEWVHRKFVTRVVRDRGRSTSRDDNNADPDQRGDTAQENGQPIAIGQNGDGGPILTEQCAPAGQAAVDQSAQQCSNKTEDITHAGEALPEDLSRTLKSLRR